MPDSRQPQKIGRYEIRDKLGHGGMAVVYRGFDPQVKRFVAIKILPQELLYDPAFRVRFEREAETIAALEHPAIVPLYDYGEEGGQPFFVMRLMSGGSLADRLKGQPLPPEECARILARLASALDEAHQRGIVHRDLKPDNILFDQQGEAYISDFGIAKLLSGATTFTGSGLVGTPAYMSPEQGQGLKDIDGRSDVYALGAILFEMLTGQMPYQADTPIAVMLKHINEPVPRVLDANPDLPPGCETVIERALAKDPAGRFATAGEMAEALFSAAGGDPLTLARPSVKRGPTQPNQPQKTIASAPAETIAPAPARSKTLVWAWVIGLLVILGLFAGIAFAVSGGAFFAAGRGTSTLDATQVSFTQAAQLAATTQANVDVTATANQEATLSVKGTAEALNTESAITAQNLQATETAQVEGAANAIAQITAEAQSTVSAQENATATVAAATANAQATTDAQLSAPRLAFIANGDIWVVNLDGSTLKQLTTDGGDKTALRWLPDGRTVSYITGLCIKTVDSLTAEGQTLTCLNYAPSVDGFEVSPDGTYFAISAEGKLHIGYYDPANLTAVKSRRDLEVSATCMLYSQNYVESARWSSDGERLAVEVQIPLNGLKADTIRLFDFACGNSTPRKLEEFPGTWFTLPAYEKKPELQNFGWDSDVLFAFTDEVRNEGFGNVYVYNTNLKRPPKQLFPLTGGACCYRDPQWSPDGKTLVFVFQDIATGANSATELYYIPYGEIGTGASATRIPLPDGFFQDAREKPQPVMAPQQ